VTRVDFYVIDDPNRRRHGVLVCRLAEKAWREGHSVHIRCADAENVSYIDDLLWTYKDTSFLPHAATDAADADTVPVTLGHGDSTPRIPDVLINLGDDVPDCFSRFERVMETTGVDPGARAAARERYRYYQDRGYALKTHKLDSHYG
jgi:DNA polymerase-3 subunit chi